MGEPQVKLPVMVWLHGGSFTSGASSDTVAENAFVLSEHGVIVVTVNYRLGAFGYLAGESLRQRDPTGSTGNYGLQDQRQALRFLQNHIGSFGGDASQVTLFGWSAGAAATSAHLVMQRSRGLFSAAIMQSGAFSSWAAHSWPQAASNFAQVSKCAGCDGSQQGNTECLLNISADSLRACSEGLTFGPTVDGIELPLAPFEAMKAGQVDTSVAVILGNARLDSLLDIGLQADRKDLRAFFSTCFPENKSLAEQAFQLYDPGDHASPTLGWPATYWAARQAATDAGFTCRSRHAARVWSDAKMAPAYWYLWDFVAPFPDFAMQAMAKSSRAVPHQVTGSCWPCPGSGHGSEIPLLFDGTPDLHFLTTKHGQGDGFVASGYPIPKDSVGSALGLALRQMWTSFAATHTPQADSIKHWEAVRGGSLPSALLLQGTGLLSPQIDAYRNLYCDFWESSPQPAPQCR